MHIFLCFIFEFINFTLVAKFSRHIFQMSMFLPLASVFHSVCSVFVISQASGSLGSTLDACFKVGFCLVFFRVLVLYKNIFVVQIGNLSFWFLFGGWLLISFVLFRFCHYLRLILRRWLCDDVWLSLVWLLVWLVSLHLCEIVIMRVLRK